MDSTAMPRYLLPYRPSNGLLRKAWNMKVFVTGATGHVGSAVVAELLQAGHQVVGLARSEANVQALTGMGAQAHRGSLDDVEALRQGAALAEGVIHCAFNHDDFSNFAAKGAAEKLAIEAMGNALAGSNRPLVIASGVAMLAPGKIATEDTVRSADMPFPRDPEGAAFAFANRGVRVSAVRLSPTTHGRGDKNGFVPSIIRAAREHGVSVYVDAGQNVWSAVHRLDAAVLFRLALEKGVAGRRYHAVAEEGLPFKDIAAVIGRCLKLPAESRSLDQAKAHFGSFAMFAMIDQRASSERTRKDLGWQPKQVGLLEDIEKNYLT